MEESPEYNLKYLVEELQNADWKRREDAAELLAELADPRAIDPLIKALDDDDCHVREAAALSLAVFSASTAALTPFEARTRTGSPGAAPRICPLPAIIVNANSNVISRRALICRLPD